MHDEARTATAVEAAPEVEYHGDDLEALSTLKRYRQWIVDEFSPYLTGRVAEIGAGIGNYSEELLCHADHLDMVEPAARPASLLQDRMADQERVRLIRSTAEEWAANAPPGSYDGVVMINVLEHIENDAAMAAEIFRALIPGGHFLLFVPALMALFSKLDAIHGHYRRYGLEELKAKVTAAGFVVETAKYVDVLGVLPWLVINKWMGQTEFKPGMISLYDRFGVPATRAVEKLIRFPFGKNVLLVARRP
ncbi:MAG: class I SAM-dependent methyltransferase [Magnetospirillum sp.]|nr:class I SAM-dependent methyltransferase [Magnetospirillum sp.]